MDSNFIRHEACPSPYCNSSDGFAVYDDGHGWCFSCGWFVEGKDSLNGKKIAQRLAAPPTNNREVLSLPAETTDELPPKVVQWLMSYGITPKEVKENQFLWNPHREELIYPIFDLEYRLLMYQARHFGHRGKQFHTKGKVEDIFHYYGKFQPRIVLVEDVISAIKVGRQAYCMPLFGSNISKERLARLAIQFSGLTIWLDSDKWPEAIRFRQRALAYFDDEIRVIPSSRDPKAYTDKEIGIWLHGLQS